MDFAVLMSDERTLVFKRGQGIVLNDATRIAYSSASKKEFKTLAVGRAVERLEQKLCAPHEKSVIAQATLRSSQACTFDSPISGGRVTNIRAAWALFGEFFKRVGSQNLAVKRRCLFCVPSSLTSAEINDFKTAIYSALVADVEFIPSVIASAIGFGYDIGGETPVLSVVIESGVADTAVIKKGEIVAGGTLEKMDQLPDAIAQISAGFGEMARFNGDRMSVISGAGKLLGNEDLIRKIVKLN